MWRQLLLSRHQLPTRSCRRRCLPRVRRRQALQCLQDARPTPTCHRRVARLWRLHNRMLAQTTHLYSTWVGSTRWTGMHETSLSLPLQLSRTLLPHPILPPPPPPPLHPPPPHCRHLHFCHPHFQPHLLRKPHPPTVLFCRPLGPRARPQQQPGWTLSPFRPFFASRPCYHHTPLIPRMQQHRRR